jgi:hypothetical protein
VKLLRPFSDDILTSKLQLRGESFREGDTLSLHFELKGPLTELVIPSLSSSPKEKDLLYKHTCFEVFLASPPKYVEWNFSPSGDWAFFSFERYREKSTRKEKPSLPPRSVWSRSENLLDLEIKLDISGLSSFLEIDRPLFLGMTAVLEGKSGTLSYWALQHSGTKPDFHQTQDFLFRF